VKSCENLLKKSALKVLILLLASFSTIPNFALAEDKIKGKYEVIGSIEKLKRVKQVEMIEFFNYSCGHCYRFLETSKKLHAKFKDKLYHRSIPFTGDNKPPPQPRLFILPMNWDLRKNLLKNYLTPTSNSKSTFFSQELFSDFHNITRLNKKLEMG